MIRIKRSEAKPNFGFTRQLREFEKNLKLNSDRGTGVVSPITRDLYFSHLPKNQKLVTFKGLETDGQSMEEITYQVSHDLGIKNISPKNNTTGYTIGHAPISRLRPCDYPEMLVRNRNDIKMSKKKLTD